MNNDKEVIDKQIEIAIQRYAFNMPKSVARAKAREIVKEAMKTYNKTTSLSTYISSKLMKLSRSSYAAGSAVKTQESSIILKKKVKDFIEEYMDNFGTHPGDKKIMDRFSISKKELDKVNILIGSGFSSSFNEDKFSSYKKPSIKDKDAMRGLTSIERKVISGSVNGKMSSSELQKKYGMKKTNFFKVKSGAIDKVRRNYEHSNIEYR